MTCTRDPISLTLSLVFWFATRAAKAPSCQRGSYVFIAIFKESATYTQ